MEIQEYQFEGSAIILCSKCEDQFDIDFTGDDTYKSVRDAIKEELLNEGWEAGKCPMCSAKTKNIEGDDSDYDDE